VHDTGCVLRNSGEKSQQQQPQTRQLAEAVSIEVQQRVSPVKTTMQTFHNPLCSTTEHLNLSFPFVITVPNMLQTDILFVIINTV
jgi:hypothetical protein